MKKLMFGLTAAVAVGAMAVESANVVGYTTKDAPKGTFRLAGIAFESADTGSLNLNDLVNPGAATVAANGELDFVNTAPHIQVQKPDGTYYLYFYISDAMYVAGYDDNDDPIVGTKAGWADEFGVLATEENFQAELASAPGTVVPGAAVWFKDPSATGEATLTSIGAVIGEDIDIDCPAAFRLRANAFPIDVDLNNAEQVTFSGLATVAANGELDFVNTAPHIQVQKPDGTYYLYFYISDAMYVAGFDDNDDPIVGTKAGWADEFGVLATEENFQAELASAPGIVPAAYGFWAKGVSTTFKMTFLAPNK